MANVMAANPKLVNSDLAPSDRALYYQVVHDYIQIFALGLTDIAQPAKTPPFQIETFGPPAHKPPIRCSLPHAKVLRT